MYFVSGIVGSIFSFIFYLLIYGGSNALVFGLGSSGAIYGLMAATYFNIPRENNRWYIFGIIYVVFQLYQSLENWSHLFGFASGVLLVFLFRKLVYKKHPNKSKKPKKTKKTGKNLVNFKNRLKSRVTVLEKPRKTTVQKTPEQEIFDRFIIILQVEPNIAIEQMAEFLHLSEIDMMKRLVIWKKKLPFTISGEFIVVESMSEFLQALENLSS
ncbi:MAG: rhomboid family intramembrane serine protease [Promethearchaeota archaeon]|nr:MAG: rhomboid family intramembrane serine protease [Candidatus Lokiarchaeota archaeon]